MDRVLTSPAPVAPWVAFVAWLALMGGLGWAARPAAPEPASDALAEVSLAQWQAAIEDAPTSSARARLWFDPAATCPCETAAMDALRAWAPRLEIELRPIAGAPPGVALVDAGGRLRYAGSPSVLVAQCRGPEGLRALWLDPDDEGFSRLLDTRYCECAPR